MTKNYWLIFTAAAIITLLLLFLLWPDKQHDTHKSHYDQVVAENNAFKEGEKQKLKVIDSLESAGRSKDSVIASLKSEKRVAQKEADKYAATSVRLAKEVKELRRGGTSDFANKCDSLAEQVQNFAFLYEQYKAYSDSLSVVMEKQKGDYETALSEQKQLYSDLKKLQDGMEMISKKIYDDLQAARKTIKRERLKTKIAGVLGAAAAVMAIIK